MKTILAVAGGALLGYWLASKVQRQSAGNGLISPGQTTDPSALHGWPVSIRSSRVRYVNPNSRLEARMVV